MSNFAQNKDQMQDSVIIVSGGMDSITLLYDYLERIGLAITFDYGSKHNAKEIPFAKLHCEKLSIQHITIPLLFINDYFKSDLLQSGGDIPEGHYESENMKSTVVPFRNGIMLSIASGIAESNGFNNILLGNHSGDHAIYPDCRPEFITAMSEAIQAGTYENVEILAPYTNINKMDIAQIGRKLNIDYSKTWTCYKGEEIHCGVCGSCVERKEALSGFDTTEYQQ
jgi:7-cyano-7-deazaguanine synthase